MPEKPNPNPNPNPNISLSPRGTISLSTDPIPNPVFVDNKETQTRTGEELKKAMDNLRNEVQKQEPNTVDEFKSKYGSNPENVMKALEAQKSENAKYRKELEALKSQVNLNQKTEPQPQPQSVEQSNQNAFGESYLSMAEAEYFDRGDISDDVMVDIKKAMNLTNDDEVSRVKGLIKNSVDAKLTEMKKYCKTDPKELLKEAAGSNKITPEEYRAAYIAIKSGIYTTLTFLENKLGISESSTPKDVAQHGEISSTGSGFNSMEEWWDARQTPGYYSMGNNNKSSQTDWNKAADNSFRSINEKRLKK